MTRNAAGTDFAFQQLFGAATTAAANVIVPSSDTSAFSASRTAPTGVYSTASAGLAPAVATYAHTTGTSTATLVKSFTCNTNDNSGSATTVAKHYVSNSTSTTAQPFWEDALSPTATLAPGDSLQITNTQTIS